MSEQQVIVVGAGLSGLATALGVALRGGSAVVLESSDLVGGAAAYSGGMVWVGANHVAAREGIADDLALAEAYVRDLTHDHPELLDEAAMHRWLETAPEAMEHWEQVGAIRWEIIPDLADYHSEAAGALDVGRYLTNAVIDGSELGEWRGLLRVSPNFPVGMTYAEMHVKGRRSSPWRPAQRTTRSRSTRESPPSAGPTWRSRRTDRRSDPLTFGTGVVASFLARALREPGVDIRLSTPVTGLLTDESGAVVGVTARRPGRPVRPARTRGARHEHLRLESRAGQGVPGPGSGGLQQPRADEPDRRRHHDGAGRGRRRRARAGHPHADRPGVGLPLGDGSVQRPRVRAPPLPHGRHHRSALLRRLVLGDHRRGRPEPRRSPPAVLPRLGRAAPSQVRARAHASRWGVPGGVRQHRRRSRHARQQARGRRRAAGVDGRPLQRACRDGHRSRLRPRLRHRSSSGSAATRATRPAPCSGRSSSRRSTAPG